MPANDAVTVKSDSMSELHLCMHLGNPAVKAAFLVDPVDNTRETPEGLDYPNAAKALRSASKPVAMCGASVITGCNPTGSNWQVCALMCIFLLWLTMHYEESPKFSSHAA